MEKQTKMIEHYKFVELVKSRNMNLGEVLHILNMIPEDMIKKMTDYIKYKYDEEK